MTDVQLVEIEQRLEGITPGVWNVFNDESGGLAQEEPYIATPEESSDTGFYYIATVHTDSAKDAEFIAHAPADITALIAEVRRLYQMLSAEPPTT